MINCSATVIPILVGDGGRLVFVRRGPEDTFAGLLVAPGGKVEETDGVEVEGTRYYTAEFAAVRWLFETTGLVFKWNEVHYFCTRTLAKGHTVVSYYTFVNVIDILKAEGFQNRVVILQPKEVMARTDFAPCVKLETAELMRKLGMALGTFQPPKQEPQRPIGLN